MASTKDAPGLQKAVLVNILYSKRSLRLILFELTSSAQFWLPLQCYLPIPLSMGLSFFSILWDNFLWHHSQGYMRVQPAFELFSE